MGVWKRRTWKKGGGLGGRRGEVTPVTVTEPVTRVGSEDEDEGEGEGEDGDGDEDDGGKMVMGGPIRRRSEGVGGDVCITSPSPKSKLQTLGMDAVADHIFTRYSFLPHHPAVRRLRLR